MSHKMSWTHPTVAFPDLVTSPSHSCFTHSLPVSSETPSASSLPPSQQQVGEPLLQRELQRKYSMLSTGHTSSLTFLTSDCMVKVIQILCVHVCMLMCMCMYMYIGVCLYTCIEMCICICLCVCVPVCIDVCACVHLCVCMCTCVYRCVCLCGCAHTCVCRCTCKHAHGPEKALGCHVLSTWCFGDRVSLWPGTYKVG